MVLMMDPPPESRSKDFSYAIPYIMGRGLRFCLLQLLHGLLPIYYHCHHRAVVMMVIMLMVLMMDGIIPNHPNHMPFGQYNVYSEWRLIKGVCQYNVYSEWR